MLNSLLFTFAIMGTEVEELERAIEYISKEIENCRSISCPSLRAISLRYLSHLRIRAMNKLAEARTKALQ